LDGISVVPALLGDASRQKRHEFLYWELPRYDAKAGEFRRETPMQAVLMGNWKAVRPQPDGELELYDLDQDIGETRNLAREAPEALKKIEAYLKTARTEPRPQKGPAWA
jgi:arylsulfatase A-like enzyme